MPPLKRLGPSLLALYAAAMTVAAAWAWCRYCIAWRFLVLDMPGGEKNLDRSFNDILDGKSHRLFFFEDWFQSLVLGFGRFDFGSLLTLILVAFGGVHTLRLIRRSRHLAPSPTSPQD